MLIERCPSISPLGQFKLDVCSSLAHHDFEIIILQTLRYFVKDQQALVPHLAVIILEEVNDVFRDSHVEAGLYFIAAASLED